jgi:large subunit ribosomal protein L24
MMKKFKKGDQVLVTAGKDKGKTGEILRVLSEKNAVIVKGANLYKKHRKATQNTPGGIISLERPLATAKVMLVEAGKPVRVGLRRDKTGKVERISKKTGKTL